MKRIVFFIIFSFCIFQLCAQELFLLTYPASNVPKNTMVFRSMNSFFQRTVDNSISYHVMPEIEYGISRKVMLIANGFLSNEANKFKFEGASFFTQYRFYSRDQSKRHFRMSLWSRVAVNNTEIHQEEIELNGHNSGIRLGLTGTQLLHKTAISTTISFQQALNNLDNIFPGNYSTNSID